MTLNLDQLFESCVRRITRPDGSLEINCRKGLWGVRGTDPAFVEREARRYWMLYFNDGEYNE